MMPTAESRERQGRFDGEDMRADGLPIPADLYGMSDVDYRRGFLAGYLDGEDACHFCGVRVSDKRATALYGEAVCDRCAIDSHIGSDPCEHDDDACPWVWNV